MDGTSRRTHRPTPAYGERQLCEMQLQTLPTIVGKSYAIVMAITTLWSTPIDFEDTSTLNADDLQRLARIQLLERELHTPPTRPRRLTASPLPASIAPETGCRAQWDREESRFGALPAQSPGIPESALGNPRHPFLGPNRLLAL